MPAIAARCCCRAGEPPRWAVKNLGTALGFEPGLEFERTELTLRPGDALVFYTDGVSEAFNPQDECYGNDRLLADAGVAGRPIRAGHHRGFAPESPRLCRQRAPVRRHRDPDAESRQAVLSGKEGSRMTLELHATPEEVMRAVDALQEFGQARQVAGEERLFGLALALEECGSNIVNHALQRDARQTFRVTLEHTGSAMVIELRDRGPEFDPTQAPVTRQAADDDDRPPGGWGIQLVRRYTDEIRYAREGGRERPAPDQTTGVRRPTKNDFARNGTKQTEQLERTILICHSKSKS